MMSQIPFDFKSINKADIDREILRAGLIAELDAVNLYEQMAAACVNPDIKKVLLEIAGEEKTHIGEFQAMLLRLDPEQVKELGKGKKEVEEMME
jgi:rubrerythrin